jgi:hypothetical protein
MMTATATNGNGKHTIPVKSIQQIAEELRDRGDVRPAPLAEPDPAERLDLLRKDDGWPGPPAPEAFHGLAGEIVRAIEPQTEADPVALLLQLLVGLGNVFGHTAYFPAGPVKHYTNEYAVVVGRTGSGKGEALSWIQLVLKECDPAWSKRRCKTGLSSGEGLLNTLRDFEGEGAAGDKRLLALETEMSSLFAVDNRKGNRITSVIRQLYDGTGVGSLTKLAVEVFGVHFSLLCHTTKPELLEMMSAVACSNGYFNRFAWICSRKSKDLPEGGKVPPLAKFEPRLKGAIGLAQEAPVLRRDAVAAKLWKEAYPWLNADRPGRFGTVTSRARVHVLRLSSIYALLDQSRWIAPEHIRAALALWAYCERSARYVFGDSTGNALADKMRKVIAAAGAEGLSGRQLCQAFKHLADSERQAVALQLLLDEGLIEKNERRTGGRGRPGVVWLIPGTLKPGTKSTNSMP